MSALRRASRAFPPRFRSIFTSPLVKSPYSTEGIPRTISTLSISSVEIVRMSTPSFTFSLAVASVSHAPFNRCILAFVLIGAPSTTKLVPNEDVAYWLFEGGVASRKRI